MKITTTLAVAFACATLAACGGGETNTAENVDANMMMTDNLGATDMNMDMNMDMNTINAADGMNSTENAMVNDLTTNTPDTNLANGM